MTILQVTKRFDYGGAENYVRELSNELVEQGNEVFVYSQFGRQVGQLNGGVKHFRAILRFQIIVLQVIRLLFLIKRHHIQIIHAHQRLAIISSCIVGFLTRIPVVVTVHGRVRHDLRSVISRTIPFRFIFVSRRVLEVSRYYNQIAKRSVVIPNGVFIKNEINTHIPYQIGYKCRLDRKHTLVLSQLFQILPQLANDFKGIRLEVIGDGKAMGKLKVIQEQINNSMGYEAVILRGFVSNFCNLQPKPELMLGVGRVAIEAAAHGCSVILVNSARLGELVSELNYDFYKQNNFVDVTGLPSTPEGLSSSIISFFKNREKHRFESLKLASMVTIDFGIETIAASICQLYKETRERCKKY